MWSSDNDNLKESVCQSGKASGITASMGNVRVRTASLQMLELIEDGAHPCESEVTTAAPCDWQDYSSCNVSSINHQACSQHGAAEKMDKTVLKICIIQTQQGIEIEPWPKGSL